MERSAPADRRAQLFLHSLSPKYHDWFGRDFWSGRTFLNGSMAITSASYGLSLIIMSLITFVPSARWRKFSTASIPICLGLLAYASMNHNVQISTPVSERAESLQDIATACSTNSGSKPPIAGIQRDSTERYQPFSIHAHDIKGNISNTICQYAKSSPSVFANWASSDLSTADREAIEKNGIKSSRVAQPVPPESMPMR